MSACEEQKLRIAVTKVCLVQPVTTALTQAYLVKVMEWKLTRGTFRPGLLQKVQQNSEEEVKTSFASLAHVFANLFAYIHEGKTARNSMEFGGNRMESMDLALSDLSVISWFATLRYKAQSNVF